MRRTSSQPHPAKNRVSLRPLGQLYDFSTTYTKTLNDLQEDEPASPAASMSHACVNEDYGGVRQ